MKILLSLNSFKETLESVEINKFFGQYLKEFEVTTAPISDGGDGFLLVINYYRNCSTEYFEVCHPILGQKVKVPFCVDEKNIYIESAKVIGLSLVPKEIRDPRFTSSFGLGELLKHIFNTPAYKDKKIIIGIGGTSTNDVGVGMASALGWEFLNEKGNYISKGAGHLNEITEINAPYYLSIPKHKIIGVADVKNPLIGKTGTTHIYSTQKGLPQSEINLMEKGVKHIAELMKKNFRLDVEAKDNFGAGGGLAAGLKYFLNADIFHWSDFLLKEKAFHKSYDFVITGEGKIDKQSFYGKVVGEILERFSDDKTKFILCCGKYEDHSIPNQYKNSVVLIEEMSKYFHSQEQAMTKTEEGLKHILRAVLKYLHHQNF